MTVFVVMQKEKPDSRIRGIFKTREKAEEYIGPPETEVKSCTVCGHSKTIRNHWDSWRKKLHIQEHKVS